MADTGAAAQVSAGVSEAAHRVNMIDHKYPPKWGAGYS